MIAGIESKKWRLILVLLVASLAPRNFASAQLRFFPIRTAPLGSPVGTVGEPVTPTFNEALDCWELKVTGGVEVDIDVQVFGWGHLTPFELVTVFATVEPSGYSNGVGGDLNPKGWPESPEDGAYQANKRCEFGGDLSPCTPPFDPTCDSFNNGFCVHAENWIMPACSDDVRAIATYTLKYTWATSMAHVCDNVDVGDVKTVGGLILEVPPDAVGTYVIEFDTDPNDSFLSDGSSTPVLGVQFAAACITISQGACCIDINSDDTLDSCQDDILQSECATSGGLFLGHAVACTGIFGACCLDGDGDGIHDTCTEMESSCCDAQGGSFSGAGSSCSFQVGACCLDSDDDSFYDTCRVINETCCDAQGGSFGAAGSQCIAFGGACCLDEGTCVEANATCCASQGGSPAGAGSACRGDADGDGTDDPCDEGFPAVSQWGLVVMVLLLLVGIKICFGRRQPTFRAWQEA